MPAFSMLYKIYKVSEWYKYNWEWNELLTEGVWNRWKWGYRSDNYPTPCQRRHLGYRSGDSGVRKVLQWGGLGRSGFLVDRDKVRGRVLTFIR